MLESNTPQIDSRYNQWLLQRADAATQEALTEFAAALASGEIPVANVGTTAAPTENNAGGVNYCPNSDLKYSTRAATVPGALASDADDNNFECFKFYRQEKLANIVTDAARALKAEGHSLYAANEGANAAIPIWNRTIGQLEFGADDAAPNDYDVAIQLYNNDVKNNDNVWYVRFSLGALLADAVPSDLEMYCGIWQKSASAEGWVTGGAFTISYRIIGKPGTQTVSYMVVAKTDAGSVLYSQILVVADAPDVLDNQNFPRISYGAANSAGFIQFEIYRMRAGMTRKIADIRNSNRITFDDDQRNAADEIPVSAFPTPPTSGSGNFTATAQSQTLDVGALGAAMLVNDFTIKIPNDYNMSETLPQGQFLRFGFTRKCAANRQIRLDRILFSPSFNVWSDSPFDPQGVAPTSAPETGTPSSGGSGGTPPPTGSGGYNCVFIETPVLRFDFEQNYQWLPFEDVPKGDVIESGLGRSNPNYTGKKRIREENEFYILYFSNDSWLPCTPKHKIFLDEFDKKGARAEDLNIGQNVWGWNEGNQPGFTTVVNKIFCRAKKALKFGTFVALKGANKRYVAGFSTHGTGVFNSNRKEDFNFDDPLMPPLY